MTSDEDLEGHDIFAGLHDLWFTLPGAAARHAAAQPPLPTTVGPLTVPKRGTATTQAPAAPITAAGQPPAALLAPKGAPAQVPEKGPGAPVPEGGHEDLQPPEISPAQVHINKQLAGNEEAGTIQLPGNTRSSAQLANRPQPNYANTAYFDMVTFSSTINSHGSLPDGTINKTQPLVAYVGSASQGDPDTIHLADA